MTTVAKILARARSVERVIAAQRAIIRKHYGLNRDVTEAELQAELDSLNRRRAAGSLNDMDMRLYSALNRRA